jgi:hypothetical protein
MAAALRILRHYIIFRSMHPDSIRFDEEIKERLLVTWGYSTTEREKS